MNVGRLFILELQEIYSLRYTFNCPSVEYPEEPPLNCISCLSSWSDQIHCLDHLLTEKSSVESKSNYALEQSQSVPLTRDYLTIQIRSVSQFVLCGHATPLLGHPAWIFIHFFITPSPADIFPIGRPTLIIHISLTWWTCPPPPPPHDPRVHCY